LGIPPSQVPLEDFQYLTRIHYLAPSDGLWGEHESEFNSKSTLLLPKTSGAQFVSPFLVDYILFITAPVTLKPNENEVCDVKWVDPAELEKLMTELDRECFGSDHSFPLLDLPWAHFASPSNL
jgi:isopentenyl-diphosphate delta-isomerase